jgi:hypothetical protein
MTPTHSATDQGLFHLVTVSGRAAIRRYFDPLVRLKRCVLVTVRRVLAPTLTAMVSRIQRIEWLEDAQLQELIALRRTIVDSKHMHASITDADTTSLRDEVTRLSANVEQLTLTIRTYAAPAEASDLALSSAVRHITDLMARIDDAWVKQIAESVVDRMIEILDSLARPTAIYRGETELYRVLTECVEALEPRDTLFAVCGEKSWGTNPVKDYLEANERAAARGVGISRIFHETADGRAIEVAQRQAKEGIRVRLLRKKHLEQLTPRQRLPAELGIAIINGETVIMHSGLGSTAYAYRFECPHLVSLVRSQFEIVERLADPVEPKPEASGAAFHRFPTRQ